MPAIKKIDLSLRISVHGRGPACFVLVTYSSAHQPPNLNRISSLIPASSASHRLGRPSPARKSSFEGGQPCERVQWSKAGGCQPRKAIPDAPSKPKPPNHAMSTPNRTGVRERCRILNSSNPAHVCFKPPTNVMPGPDRASRQHNLKASHPSHHEHPRPDRSTRSVRTCQTTALRIAVFILNIVTLSPSASPTSHARLSPST